MFTSTLVVIENAVNHRVISICNHWVIFNVKPLGYNFEMNEENVSKEPAIAARLYQLMNETGVNKSGLARICGVSPQAAGRWFTKGKMSKDSALKISEAFGVSLTWLLSDAEDVDDQVFDNQFILSEKHKNLLRLFDRLPETEQDNHLETLKIKVENYDKLFFEMLKGRNIKEIIKSKRKK
ncbi:MAG: helix-turn-helix domain-containing protein [Serratia sp. (in: enterobacteria)]|uniref:helix-turn-helix domain-containing protein n=1 Tax=Serratia sp. (in: enterobacteria) TaxID=616 RepID=UPI003F33756F